MSRWGEYFEDDSTYRRSMNRLATFIALVALCLALFWTLALCTLAKGADLVAYLGAATTIVITIAGLGGFNYTVGRASSAYTQVKVAQAEKGIQSAPPPAPVLGPTTVMNIGARQDTIPAKDVAIKAQGDVNVTAKKGKK